MLLGFSLLWVLLVLPSLGSAAEVRASLNQAQVYEGDQVLLTIEREGRGASSEPDLSPLADDFEVGGLSTSQQTQIINGRRSDQTSWQVGLRPKRLGRLSIPPIQVGSATTEPLSLTVEAVPEGGLGGPGDQVWVEVELGEPGKNDDGSPAPLVVQQQVPLVVRAYSAQPLIDYAIEMPAVEGAALTRIGRDQGSMMTRAGQQYRVIERRYSLNPERSGRLRIAPIVFEAELKTEPGRGSGSPATRGLSDLFDDPMIERMFGGMRFGPTGSMFERGEPARAQSEALVLEVKTSAKEFSGEHWLPATGLEVEDSWNPADGGRRPSLAVGEPATRTLTLTARGLAGNQIPDIKIPAPPGFRIYPGQTEAETRSDGQALIGISQQQVTLIPTSGGDVEMPPIEVFWWDTEAGEERTATVPALRLSVAGPVADAAPAADSTRTAEVMESGEPAVDADPRLSDGQGDAAEAAGGLRRVSGWGERLDWGPVGLAAILLFISFAAVVIWRRRRPALAGSTEVRTSVATQTRQAREALRSACERHDPRAAEKALLDWAVLRWPDDPPTGLGALAGRAEQAAPAIRSLEHRLYGVADHQGDWQGDALWAVFKDGLGGRPRSVRALSDGLAPLYPGPDERVRS